MHLSIFFSPSRLFISRSFLPQSNTEPLRVSTLQPFLLFNSSITCQSRGLLGDFFLVVRVVNQVKNPPILNLSLLPTLLKADPPILPWPSEQNDQGVKPNHLNKHHHLDHNKHNHLNHHYFKMPQDLHPPTKRKPFKEVPPSKYQQNQLGKSFQEINPTTDGSSEMNMPGPNTMEHSDPHGRLQRGTTSFFPKIMR